MPLGPEIKRMRRGSPTLPSKLREKRVTTDSLPSTTDGETPNVGVKGFMKLRSSACRGLYTLYREYICYTLSETYTLYRIYITVSFGR